MSSISTIFLSRCCYFDVVVVVVDDDAVVVVATGVELQSLLRM